MMRNLPVLTAFLALSCGAHAIGTVSTSVDDETKSIVVKAEHFPEGARLEPAVLVYGDGIQIEVPTIHGNETVSVPVTCMEENVERRRRIRISFGQLGPGAHFDFDVHCWPKHRTEAMRLSLLRPSP